jgi:hypothetical protein
MNPSFWRRPIYGQRAQRPAVFLRSDPQSSSFPFLPLARSSFCAPPYGCDLLSTSLCRSLISAVFLPYLCLVSSSVVPVSLLFPRSLDLLWLPRFDSSLLFSTSQSNRSPPALSPGARATFARGHHSQLVPTAHFFSPRLRCAVARFSFALTSAPSVCGHARIAFATMMSVQFPHSVIAAIRAARSLSRCNSSLVAVAPFLSPSQPRLAQLGSFHRVPLVSRPLPHFAPSLTAAIHLA